MFSSLFSFASHLTAFACAQQTEPLDLITVDSVQHFRLPPGISFFHFCFPSCAARFIRSLSVSERIKNVRAQEIKIIFDFHLRNPLRVGWCFEQRSNQSIVHLRRTQKEMQNWHDNSRWRHIVHLQWIDWVDNCQLNCIWIKNKQKWKCIACYGNVFMSRHWRAAIVMKWKIINIQLLIANNKFIRFIFMFISFEKRSTTQKYQYKCTQPKRAGSSFFRSLFSLLFSFVS